MTNEQLKYAFERGKMKLGLFDKFNHYGIVGFFFSIPITLIFLHLKEFVQNNPKPSREGEIFFIIIPSLLGILFYFLQKNSLKFKSIETKLTREELDLIIEKVANELKWTFYTDTKKVIIAKTHPNFFSGSWGEQITILFDKNRVLVNSICDLDTKSSIVSMGRNKKNMYTLIDEILKTSH